MRIVDEYKTAIIGIEDYEFFRLVDNWVFDNCKKWIINTAIFYDELVPYLVEKNYVFNSPDLTDYKYVTFKRTDN